LQYFFGDGVPQDFTEAIKWYRKAAQLGNVEAQFNLGGIYQEGVVVPQDSAEATEWYLKAVDQGHEKARYNLEVMSLNRDKMKNK